MAPGAQEAVTTTEDTTSQGDTVNSAQELSTSDKELDSLKEALAQARRESAENAARADTERKRREEYEQKAGEETANRQSAEEVAISNAIAAATAKAEKLEKDIVEAQENGKFADAARLTRQLASAQNEIDRWENQKVQFEKQKEEVKRESAKDVKQDSRTPRYTDATAQWIDKHPQFLTDPVYHNKAMAAHYAAKAAGIPLDSAEYFRHIEDAIEGKSQQEEIQENRQKESAHTQSSVRTAAPPSRGTMSTGTTKQTNGQTKLTASQVETAIFTYPKLSAADAMKKYAEGLTKAVSDGKMTADGKYAN